jgi:hypothetical protein
VTVRALLVLLAFACGEEAPLPNVNTGPATVRFDYRASTTTDPLIEAEHPDCTGGVRFTHIHPSWQRYDAFALKAEGPELWTLTFEDVPMGANRIRVSDPNACTMNATGAVTATVVFANDVLLTKRVATPGTGTEPGFGFTVEENGSIVP